MDTPADNTTEAPVIEMNGVTINSLADPDRVVLEDVNWKVSAGNFWVIAGMQGSGKTDLLSATAGLMPPQKGSYKLFGCDMPIYDQERLPERLRLGLVFDNGQLFHQLTVSENIALPLRYHRHLSWEDVEAQVKLMLDLTELSNLSNARSSSLGRDAQKRAGLARALILHPEVLLVDNPLSGLDMRQANWWLNMLGQLAAGHSLFGGRRLTLVVTIQDLRPWRNLDCHFAILKKQRFIALGHCPKFAGHTEPLVKELLAEALPTT
jgi:phospholipid/cholesterol/gamma-HCH transport system ATP-binding protein